jgi:hypothetical protein
MKSKMVETETVTKTLAKILGKAFYRYMTKITLRIS